MAFDIAAKFTEPADSFNITAEIPGTKPDSGFVMLGGHFDSWTGGTGATDNAAGSAVAIEALRILRTLGLKMDRTVRLGAMDGRGAGVVGVARLCQGALGTDMKLKPEQAKLSAYYNLDNGGGKIRGIYLQDNDLVRPIFDAWLLPFKDLGVTTTTIRNTGNKDHVSFDSVGLPGFQLVQDPLEYLCVRIIRIWICMTGCRRGIWNRRRRYWHGWCTRRRTGQICCLVRNSRSLDRHLVRAADAVGSGRRLR